MPTKKSLTPDQLFKCRVGLAFRILPSAVDDIGTLDYDMLRQYWDQEPWGTWRDNMHIAILAHHIRSALLGSKGVLPMYSYFVMSEEDRAKKDVVEGAKTKKGFMSALRMMAGKKKRKDELK